MGCHELVPIFVNDHTFNFKLSLCNDDMIGCMTLNLDDGLWMKIIISNLYCFCWPFNGSNLFYNLSYVIFIVLNDKTFSSFC